MVYTDKVLNFENIERFFVRTLFLIAQVFEWEQRIISWWRHLSACNSVIDFALYHGLERSRDACLTEGKSDVPGMLEFTV